MSSNSSRVHGFEQRALAAQASVTPWLDPFIAEFLRSEGDFDSACEAANVTPAEVHALKLANPVVDAALAKAMKTIRSMRAQRLETIAFHDAAFGAKKYKFTPTGEPVAHPETGEAYYELERDHRLLTTLLQSLDRETYGPRQILTGVDGGPIQVAHAVATLADVVRISALLDKGEIKSDEVVGEILDAEVVENS